MLFNSFAFLFAFLPITFILWRVFYKVFGIRAALAFLSFSSLIFYAFWDIRYLWVLLGSISINFLLGGRILAAKQRSAEILAKRWLALGIVFNLSILGGFKYTYFVVSNFFNLLQQEIPIDPIVLPLAISFVTFQKIAYLVDCQRGLIARHNLLDYGFFVSFFPQLIAGPIVHHKLLISQIDEASNPLFSSANAYVAGVSFLAIGLFKKVVIADSLARYSTPIFGLAQTVVPSGEASWQAMLAYTLQLYFDFSGYSDMAIGLALIFGFRLPINFNSPYKATSIIEFWRRWHISLSTFLRDYLYIPLGGNRKGKFSRYRNVLITMVLAGIWHGAGWNFFLWGFVHGIFLLLNHAWHNAVSASIILRKIDKNIPYAFKVSCTFTLVAFLWVLFRASDLGTAANMYGGLFQPLTGASFPTPQWHSCAALAEGFTAASVEMGWIWISVGLLIVIGLPSSAQLLKYDATPNQPYLINPGFGLGAFVGIVFWFAWKWIGVRPATEFLYFNF